MSKTPAWIKLHIMLACALLFAGCVHADIAETPEIHVPSAAAATEKVYKDTLVFARPEAPGVFDPVLGDDTATTRLYHSIIPGLVQVSEQGEIVPDLAESWETSEDGLEWTFHLRPGLRFSDGSPVTADDWAFKKHRGVSMEFYRQGYCGHPGKQRRSDTDSFTGRSGLPCFIDTI